VISLVTFDEWRSVHFHYSSVALSGLECAVKKRLAHSLITVHMSVDVHKLLTTFNQILSQYSLGLFEID